MLKEFFTKNKHILILLLFGVVSIFVSFFYIGYSSNFGSDASEFGEAATFLLQGGPLSKEVIMNRLLPSPLFLHGSALIDTVVHNLSLSFSVVNILFYLLLIPAFYSLVLSIYKEKRVAFLSTILVIFNFYVINPGNAHLADMPGWFFLLTSTYLAVKYVNTYNKKFYYLSILLATMGFFFKEYGGLGLVNLGLLILVSDLPIKRKIKDVVLAGVLSAIPIISYHLFIYFQYHASYLGKFLNVPTSATSAPGYESKSFVLLVKILGWLFSFGWVAFLFGVAKEWQTKNTTRIKILLATLPATLTFLLWPAITQRLAVILMFWLALVGGFGLSKMKWYWLYLFLAIYILFNLNIKILITQINLPFI